MIFTLSLPFLYHYETWGGRNIYGRDYGSEAVTSCIERHNSRGGLPDSRRITGDSKEVKFDSRRVHIAGEQFLCRRGAVPYQRAEEAEREKNSILFDKVATFPVYFKFVSNRRGRELHF